MKKSLVVLLALALIGLAGYSQRATIAEKLVTAALPRQMATIRWSRSGMACTWCSVAPAARCPHRAPRDLASA